MQAKRKRIKSENSRKTFTYQYHLRKNGQRLRVCNTMFLNTLALGDWFVRNAIQSFSVQNTSSCEIPPKRNKHHDRGKEEKEYLKTEFFDKLP